MSKVPQLLYIVQDYNQQVVHVSSTLEKALPHFEEVLNHTLVQADLAELKELYGEDEVEIDYPPCIVVHEVDGHHVWSYDSIEEVNRALVHGEDYE